MSACGEFEAHAFKPQVCRNCRKSKAEHGGAPAGEPTVTPDPKPVVPKPQSTVALKNDSMSSNPVASKVPKPQPSLATSKVETHTTEPVASKVPKPQPSLATSKVETHTTESECSFQPHPFKPEMCKECRQPRKSHAGQPDLVACNDFAAHPFKPTMCKHCKMGADKHSGIFDNAEEKVIEAEIAEGRKERERQKSLREEREWEAAKLQRESEREEQEKEKEKERERQEQEMEQQREREEREREEGEREREREREKQAAKVKEKGKLSVEMKGCDSFRPHAFKKDRCANCSMGAAVHADQHIPEDAAAPITKKQAEAAKRQAENVKAEALRKERENEQMAKKETEKHIALQQQKATAEAAAKKRAQLFADSDSDGEGSGPAPVAKQSFTKKIALWDDDDDDDDDDEYEAQRLKEKKEREKEEREKEEREKEEREKEKREKEKREKEEREKEEREKEEREKEEREKEREKERERERGIEEAKAREQAADEKEKEKEKEKTASSSNTQAPKKPSVLDRFAPGTLPMPMMGMPAPGGRPSSLRNKNPYNDDEDEDLGKGFMGIPCMILPTTGSLPPATKKTVPPSLLSEQIPQDKTPSGEPKIIRKTKGPKKTTRSSMAIGETISIEATEGSTRPFSEPVKVTNSKEIESAQDPVPEPAPVAEAKAEGSRPKLGGKPKIPTNIFGSDDEDDVTEIKRAPRPVAKVAAPKPVATKNIFADLSDSD